MSRPRNPNLDLALAAMKTNTLTAAQAAKLYGVQRSSISRALKQDYCPCCGRAKQKAQAG